MRGDFLPTEGGIDRGERVVVPIAGAAALAPVDVDWFVVLGESGDKELITFVDDGGHCSEIKRGGKLRGDGLVIEER